MKTGIELKPEMGAAVVQHLRQFGDLPQSGIIAGQAVDSAITDLFGKGGGVYNDVDIFIKTHYGVAARNGRHKISPTLMRGSMKQVVSQAYGGMAIVLSVADSYGIASVSRKDMLNHVFCYKANGQMTKPLTASEIIETFDINCTRVAVDLATGQLIWDRHYEEFLQSRQLRIAMVHTPWHTFLRLVKKSKELPGVYTDLEEAAQVCTAVSQAEDIQQLIRSKHISLMFGMKHAQQAQDFRADMEPFFSLNMHAHERSKGSSRWRAISEESLQERIAKEGPMARLRARVKPTFNSVIEKGFQDPFAALEDFRRLNEGKEMPSYEDETSRLLWSMSSRGAIDAEVQQRVNKLGMGALFLAPRVIAQSRVPKKSRAYVKWNDFVQAQKAEFEDEGRNPMESFALQCAEIQGLDYTKGQALPTLAKQIDSYVKKHPRMSHCLATKSLSEQRDVIERVKNVCAKFVQDKPGMDGVAQQGVLENEARSADFDSEERLLAVLEEAYKRDGQPFELEALALPSMPEPFKDFVVEELLSTYALREEGTTQHHCVGGYSSVVRANRSRILRIRHRSDRSAWSTAELRVVKRAGTKSNDDDSRGSLKDKEFTLGQHFAALNKPVDKRNAELLKFVMAVLNLTPERRKAYGEERLSTLFFEHYEELNLLDDIQVVERELLAAQEALEEAQQKMDWARKRHDRLNERIAKLEKTNPELVKKVTTLREQQGNPIKVVNLDPVRNPLLFANEFEGDIDF